MKDLNRSLFEKEYKKSAFFYIQWIIQMLLMGGQLVIIIILGGRAVFTDILSLGSLLMILLLINHLYSPIYGFGNMLNNLHSANSVFSRIHGMIERPKEDRQSGQDIVLTQVNKIDCQNLSFSYAHKTVLNNLDISFERGKLYGIKGISGKGKSTFLKLLLRFYEVERGNIYIDGIPIEHFSLKSLRKNIAYCAQHPFIFNASIKMNIILERDYNGDKLNEVIEMAVLEDWIKSLPQGLDTFIEEGGKNISGGQAQRINIARVLYKDSPVLLFDEATSSVDISTERDILINLKKKASEKLIICITHRHENLELFDEVKELV